MNVNLNWANSFIFLAAASGVIAFVAVISLGMAYDSRGDTRLVKQVAVATLLVATLMGLVSGFFGAGLMK